MQLHSQDEARGYLSQMLLFLVDQSSNIEELCLKLKCRKGCNEKDWCKDAQTELSQAL